MWYECDISYLLPVIMIECRVLVVGDKGVGKSSLIRRFITGNYDEVRYSVTVFLSSSLFFFRKHLILPIFNSLNFTQ